MSGMVMVRVLQQMSGTRNGEPWPERGETMMVTPEEADQLALGQTPIAIRVVVEPEPATDEELEAAGVKQPEDKEPEGDTAKTPGPAATAAAKAKPAGARTQRAGGAAK